MKRGVTLVELAIVLVIIGLLVTGVMAGTMLIQEAKVNKNIGELQSISGAVITFQLKYKSLPGDLKNPTRFFPVCNGTKELVLPDMGGGNGDGMIYLSDTGYESDCVWPQMAISGLYIPLGPRANAIASGNPSADIVFSEGDAESNAIWPEDSSNIASIFFQPNSVISASSQDGNYLYLTGIIKNQPALNASDAYSIDRKMDDGRPASGKIMSIAGRIEGVWQNCFNNIGDDPTMATATSDYSVSVNTKSCRLYYRVQ